MFRSFPRILPKKTGAVKLTAPVTELPAKPEKPALRGYFMYFLKASLMTFSSFAA